MTEPRYHVNVFWSDEDQVFIADVPDLRYCTTHGQTRAEAMANAAEVIDMWLETAREDGMPVPEPRYRPAIYAARFAEAA